MKKGLNEFIDRMKADKDLTERLLKADAEYTGDRQDIYQVVRINILPIAEEEGYSFTAEEYVNEIQARMGNQRQEGLLSDDDMDAVAGGTEDVNLEGATINGDLIIIDESVNIKQNYYISIIQ